MHKNYLEKIHEMPDEELAEYFKYVGLESPVSIDLIQELFTRRLYLPFFEKVFPFQDTSFMIKPLPELTNKQILLCHEMFYYIVKDKTRFSEESKALIETAFKSLMEEIDLRYLKLVDEMPVIEDALRKYVDKLNFEKIRLGQ